MFNETITLFNYHKATEKWYPSVLERASFYPTRASSDSTRGTNNSDNGNLIVHGVSRDKSIATCGGVVKSFLTPKEYENCANPSSSITFKPECDFFYVGSYSTSVVNDEDYDSGFYHYMNDKYDGVMMVTSYSFFSLLPHFEVQGR